MTPHLPVSSHHLFDALPPPHRRRRRRRRHPAPPRLCSPRPQGPRALRCAAEYAASPAAAAGAAAARVFVVSDLHTDYPDNMEWVRRIPRGGGGDALVVAGDVAETRDNFARTMAALRERFEAVFYVPGNHDLWLRREGEGRFMDSLEKLTALLDACSELGVDTRPRTIGGLGIIPLYSWYHKSFDKEKDVHNSRVPSLDMACKDFTACKWPTDLANDDEALALHFDRMNDENHDAIEEVKSSSNNILTFSHFVPRQELCPEKRMLFYPFLPKIIGSDFLERRLRLIHGETPNGTACHVFGHTHFCWDSVVDHIRYVQAPLAYPRERKRRMNGGEDWLPFCIYDDGLTPESYPALWSDYYNKNERDPDNTDLAPWVSRFYKKYY